MKGFTLIEVIIYVAIVMGMVTATFVIINNILEAQERNAINIEVFDNINFAMRKIAWALDDATTINQPSANATGTILSIDKASSSENSFVFDINSSTLQLSTASGTAFALTNDRVLVDEVTFQHVDPDIGPSSVRIILKIKNTPRIGLTTYNASSTIETSIFMAN